MLILAYIARVPRSSTRSDVFNVVGDAHRRRILELLADGERSVNEVVDAFDLDQPSVSKHLRTLKDVGLVGVRREGRRRVYHLKADGLKSVSDWVSQFERFWDHHLAAVKQRAERKARDGR